jgi:integrase
MRLRPPRRPTPHRGRPLHLECHDSAAPQSGLAHPEHRAASAPAAPQQADGKPPLRPSHVWSIRTKLQIAGRTRDLALFNLAIDSKLRGCDVVAVRVDDVAPNGYTLDRATVRQKKTGRPVRFELTEQTRQALDDYLCLTGRKAGDFLFAGRAKTGRGLTTRQYARLVGEWISCIGLER